MHRLQGPKMGFFCLFRALGLQTEKILFGDHLGSKKTELKRKGPIESVHLFLRTKKIHGNPLGNFRNPRGANLDMQKLGPNGALRMFRTSGPKAREFGKPSATLGIFALQKKVSDSCERVNFSNEGQNSSQACEIPHIYFVVTL